MGPLAWPSKVFLTFLSEWAHLHQKLHTPTPRTKQGWQILQIYFNIMLLGSTKYKARITSGQAEMNKLCQLHVNMDSNATGSNLTIKMASLLKRKKKVGRLFSLPNFKQACMLGFVLEVNQATFPDYKDLKLQHWFSMGSLLPVHWPFWSSLWSLSISCDVTSGF